MVKMTLYQGDCLKVLPTLPDESVDLVVTDPPYGIEYQSARRKQKFEKLLNDDNLDWVSPCMKEIYRVLKNNTAFYCFTGWEIYPYWKEQIEKAGFKIRNLLVVKRRHSGTGDTNYSFAPSYEMVIFAMKGKRQYERVKYLPVKRMDKRLKNKSGYRYRLPDLIDFIYSGEFNLSMEHPTQKSLDIIKLFIEYHSKKGDTVLDPFLGSGTTMLASLQTGRNSIGIEIEPKYIEITKKRLNWGQSLGNVEFEFIEVNDDFNP